MKDKKKRNGKGQHYRLIGKRATHKKNRSVCTLLQWDGQEWVLGSEAKVVGRLAVDDFLNVVSAGRPKCDDEAFYKPLEEQLKKRCELRENNPSYDEDFSEV